MRLTDRRNRAGVMAGATRGRAAFGADRHRGLVAAARPFGRGPFGGSLAKALAFACPAICRQENLRTRPDAVLSADSKDSFAGLQRNKIPCPAY